MYDKERLAARDQSRQWAQGFIVTCLMCVCTNTHTSSYVW
jgi:hypothetical protein